MKVLLLANEYRPGKVAFRRVGAIVRYLSESGDEVTVASTKLRSASGWWGERVIPLGRALELTSTPIASSRLPPLGMGMFDRSTLSWLGHSITSPALRDAARTADVVISTYGPAGPTWAAYALSLFFRRPLALDIRDVPESRTSDGRLQRALVRLLEGIVIGRAALVSTVGDVLSAYLSKRHGVKVVSIFNGWVDTDRVQANPQTRGNYLYYAGSVYGHQLAAFEVVCSALASVEGLTLKVRLLQGDADALNGIAGTAGVGGRVEILPPVDSQIVQEEVAGARMVLVLEALQYRAAWQAGTVTGKLIGLIAGGKQGIAVCRRDSELSSIASRFPWWGVAADRNSLAALLNATDPEVEPELDNLLEPFKMELQIKRLREYLGDIVTGRRPASKS